MNPQPTLDELLSPGYFANATTIYDDNTAEWWRSTEYANEKRMQLAGAKAAAEEFEAEIIANGGFGEFVIDGTNAEKRKAQTAWALANHAGYQEAMDDIRKLERDIANDEATAERCVHVLRGIRGRLDWVTAQANWAAAIAATKGQGIEGR